MKMMSAVGMELSTGDLTVAWTTPVIGLLLGVVVTVLAAYIPARRWMQGLPDGRAARRRDACRRPVRLDQGGIGLLLTAVGGAALWVTTQADKATEGSMYLALGVLLTLIGFIVIGPLLAGVVVRALSVVVLRLFGPVGF